MMSFDERQQSFLDALFFVDGFVDCKSAGDEKRLGEAFVRAGQPD
jgi:hypothetical protein